MEEEKRNKPNENVSGAPLSPVSEVVPGLASLGSVYTTGAVMVTRYFVLIFAKKKIFFLSQAWWYIPVVLVCVWV